MSVFMAGPNRRTRRKGKTPPTDPRAPFILRKLYREFPIQPITRKETSSPATGYSGQHKAEQQEIIEKTFDLKRKSKSKKKEKATPA